MTVWVQNSQVGCGGGSGGGGSGMYKVYGKYRLLMFACNQIVTSLHQ